MSERYIDLPAVTRLTGRVQLPPSKSLVNRVLLLGALATGTTHIRPFPSGEDTRVMLAALADLGVCYQESGPRPNALVIKGVAGCFPSQAADIQVRNAGTVMRFLTAVLALQGGQYRLSGVDRMQERPIGDLVSALSTLGCQIDFLGVEGYPPLRIYPGKLSIPDELLISGATSSQFVTALLMALPLLSYERKENVVLKVVTACISAPYIRMTIALMHQFGVVVKQLNEATFEVPLGQSYRSPGEVVIEGDASNATYFAAAAALGQGPIIIEGLCQHSGQGDIQFIRLLRNWGAAVEWENASVTIRAQAGWRPPNFDMDLSDMPDAAMTLAIMALFAPGACILRGIGSWRFKETDRIQAMANELRKVGAGVEENRTSLTITPPDKLRPAEIATYDDHRMAMCFSLVALGGSAVRIHNPDCVKKTFPFYFKELIGLYSVDS